MEQKASVGRAVHYVSHGTPIREDGTQAYTSLCRHAAITEVDPNDPTVVGLHVVHPNGHLFQSLSAGGSRYHEGDIGHDHTGEEIPARSYRGGSWHWPERV